MKKRFTFISSLFLGLGLMLSFPSAYAQSDYSLNFDKEQGYTRDDRHLDAVTIVSPTDGAQTLHIPTPQKVYTELFQPAVNARAGEEISVSFGYTGTWMNGYVYVDLKNDGKFDVLLGDNAEILEGSDLLAFSHLQDKSGTGRNSKGATVNNANVLNPPTFKLPDNLAPGIYRMRLKVDWDSEAPGGSLKEGNDILKNGGAIVDVRLNIHGDYCNVTAAAENGSLSIEDASAAEGLQAPFGRPLEVKVDAHEGYVFDGVWVLHGHQLDGENLLHGTPQYVETPFAGYLMKDGILTLPASVMDGDVRLKAVFLPHAGGTGEDAADYALNFDASQEGNFDASLLKNIKFESSDERKTTLSLHEGFNTVYTSLLPSKVSMQRGSKMQVTVNNEGEGLHAYLYVDLNQDGQFSYHLSDDGVPGLSSELLAYSYYNEKNSLGESVAETVGTTLPAFTFPADLPNGVYRGRLKLDVNNTDPAGRWGESDALSIEKNGGRIVDFLLNVYKEKHSLELISVNGSILGSDNTALPLTITPFERISIVPKPIESNYKADSIYIRHGHALDGPQYVHGNCQWETFVVATKNYTIPLNVVDGDVEVAVDFQPTDRAVYHLVFSDEFNEPDGTQPDASKWIRCQRQGATWNRWLSDSEEVVYQENGQLVARAIPNPDQKSDPVPMITGGIKSMGKFGFTYGKVECRALSNPWIGNFPAIWMMPEDQSAGWPDCGEIDIWEVIDAQETSYHTIHSNWTYDLGNKNNPQSSFNTPVPLDRYHTYGLEWDKNNLKWYVDGKLIGTYSKSTNQSTLKQGQWPFDKHFHLILNQSVGNGSWAANADVNHIYETRFDWIRVYQKKGQENTMGIVGIDAQEMQAEVDVQLGNGSMQISASAPQKVVVADVYGRTIFSRLLNGNVHLQLNKGIYIVNGKKVMVN